jgi:non-ribosomal peptide synthetase component F
VTFEGSTVSYAELNARANRLARYLVERGAGPERFVALVLPRSVELVVAVLAVLKSGAAYVPVDPDHPADRIDFMLADTDPVLVIRPDDVDILGYDDSDPGVPVSRGVRDLHVGVDGASEGCGGPASERGAVPALARAVVRLRAG